MNSHSYQTIFYRGAYIHSHAEGDRDVIRIQFKDGRARDARTLLGAKGAITRYFKKNPKAERFAEGSTSISNRPQEPHP